jgi:hypothetical protein
VLGWAAMTIRSARRRSILFLIIFFLDAASRALALNAAWTTTASPGLPMLPDHAR